MPYKDKSKKAAYQAAYQAAHKKEKAAYQAAYQAAHKKEISEWKASHKKEIAAHQAAYRAAHKKEKAAQDAKNIADHPEWIAKKYFARSCGIPRDQVPPIALELKTLMIKQTREMRKIRKGTK